MHAPRIALRELLERLADRIEAHPWRTIALTGIPTLLLSLYAFQAPSDLTFTGLLDRDDPIIARYMQVSQEVNFAGRLPLLLEGPEEQLEAAAQALKPALEAMPTVADVVVELPEVWLKAHAPWIVDRALFDGWVRLATHPEDTANAKALADGLTDLQKKLESAMPQGARLVLVQLRDDPFSVKMGDGHFEPIDVRTQEVLRPFGVTGSYAGYAALSAQDQKRTLGRVRQLTPVSLLLVLLLITIVERRLLYLGAVTVPMLLSMGATISLMAFLTDKVTLMETFFGVMIFGLGVDYGVHLMVRLQEERQQEGDFNVALKRALVGVGPGIISGAVTTLGAFFIVAAAPEPMTLHLGLSGGIGLALCLALMLTLLPALWILIGRKTPPARASAVHVRAFERVALSAGRHPWLHVGIILAVMAFSLWGTRTFHFETDLSRVFNRQVPAVQTALRIEQLFGVNTSPWLVLTKDLEEARQVTKRFQADPALSRVESAALLLPEDLDERARILADAHPRIEQQRQKYESLLPMMILGGASQYQQLITLLQGLEDALAVGPPTLEGLPESLKKQLLTDRGDFVVYTYFPQGTNDGMVARQERLKVQSIHPDAVGFGMMLEATMAVDRPWVIPVGLLICIFVAAVVLIDFRSVRWTILALAPVIFGTLSTVGLISWLGYGYNVMTLVAVPLIVGLGVDNGIHVVHRLIEDETAPAYEAVSHVGSAILMTTSTTCASFVVLLFTDHAGLESMAMVLLVGLPLCLWGSISLVPALGTLLRQTHHRH